MNVHGQHYRTIWPKPGDERVIQLIDQRALPHQFVIEDVRTVTEMAAAIREMHVRGAGLIGAAAAYGMYLATFEPDLNGAAEQLKATRPTAVNLAWAIDRQLDAIAAADSLAEKRDGRFSDRATNRRRRCGVLPANRRTRPQIDAEPERRKKTAAASMSSPIAMPAGWRLSIMGPPLRRFTRRTTPGFRSTSGWTKRARAARARSSPPGN